MASLSTARSSKKSFRLFFPFADDKSLHEVIQHTRITDGISIGKFDCRAKWKGWSWFTLSAFPIKPLQANALKEQHRSGCIYIGGIQRVPQSQHNGDETCRKKANRPSRCVLSDSNLHEIFSFDNFSSSNKGWLGSLRPDVALSVCGLALLYRGILIFIVAIVCCMGSLAPHQGELDRCVPWWASPYNEQMEILFNFMRVESGIEKLLIEGITKAIIGIKGMALCGDFS